jgi:hypothetical protein
MARVAPHSTTLFAARHRPRRPRLPRAVLRPLAQRCAVHTYRLSAINRRSATCQVHTVCCSSTPSRTCTSSRRLAVALIGTRHPPPYSRSARTYDTILRYVRGSYDSSSTGFSGRPTVWLQPGRSRRPFTVANFSQPPPQTVRALSHLVVTCVCMFDNRVSTCARELPRAQGRRGERGRGAFGSLAICCPTRGCARRARVTVLGVLEGPHASRPFPR